MSDIFNEYAKLMSDKGLVKEAQTKEDDGNSTRRPGVDLEAIEMLYHVKPNGEEDHIMEQAHPDPVMIAPSYDRMNGLVENELERQNVTMQIAQNPNHGKLTHHRYVSAHNELLQEVIKSACLLDNKGQDDLMKLADACAQQLSNYELPVKEAGAFLYVLPAMAVGVMALINHFGGAVDAGVLVNIDRAIEELSDITEDADLMPGQTQDINSLISNLRELKMMHQDLSRFSVDPEAENVTADLNEGKSTLNKYVHKSQEVIKQIDYLLRIMSSVRDNSDTSSILSDWLGDTGVLIEKGIEYLWSDEIKDAMQIIKTLRSSLYKSISKKQEYYNIVKSKYQAKKLDFDFLNPEKKEESEEQLVELTKDIESV